jgi:two-component system, OmpR family, KDP operon response regulator KdpE
MKRILVIDDEPQFLRALATNLRGAGYDVETATTAGEALAAAGLHPPDAIVLDLLLPDGTGTEVCRELRTWSTAPIVVVSAVGDEPEKIAALDAGADDYVTKPFAIGELLARLRAALRRSAPGDDAPVVVATSFTVDLAARQVRDAGGEPVRLTPTEWHLLEVLVRNEGKLVGRRELLQEVWGPAYGTEANYLRVYMAQLRRKLEADPAHPRHLLTEPGMGYRFTQ